MNRVQYHNSTWLGWMTDGLHETEKTVWTKELLLGESGPSLARKVCNIVGGSLSYENFVAIGSSVSTTTIDWPPIPAILQECWHKNSPPIVQDFIRPHLEYCSIVWDPYSAKDVEALEKVQRFALRVCLKQWDLNQEKMLQASGPDTLADREVSC